MRASRRFSVCAYKHVEARVAGCLIFKPLFFNIFKAFSQGICPRFGVDQIFYNVHQTFKYQALCRYKRLL